MVSKTAGTPSTRRPEGAQKPSPATVDAVGKRAKLAGGERPLGSAAFGGARRGLTGDDAADREEPGGEDRVPSARTGVLAPHAASTAESAAQPATTPAARARRVRIMGGDYEGDVTR